MVVGCLICLCLPGAHLRPPRQCAGARPRAPAAACCALPAPAAAGVETRTGPRLAASALKLRHLCTGRPLLPLLARGLATQRCLLADLRGRGASDTLRLFAPYWRIDSWLRTAATVSATGAVRAGGPNARGQVCFISATQTLDLPASSRGGELGSSAFSAASMFSALFRCLRVRARGAMDLFLLGHVRRPPCLGCWLRAAAVPRSERYPREDCEG